MLDEILRRINYLFYGALLVIIGAVGSFVGVAFLSITLFGDGQFEIVAFLIGAFSLTTGPPATLAGVRLLFNMPNESGGLLSPNMLRIFAFFFAILGVFTVWLAHRQHLTVSVFIATFFIVVTQQAFALARRRESGHLSDPVVTSQMISRTTRPSKSSTSSQSPDAIHHEKTQTEDSTFEFVYVTEEGTVRELSPGEKRYLSKSFQPFDGGRPYVKESFWSSDGWGGQSGFLERSKVPPAIPIEAVNPDYDAQYEALMDSRSFDPCREYRGAGGSVSAKPDGSVEITFDPEIPAEARFEKIRRQKELQRREEQKLARLPDETANH